jgi:chemotaxis protein methyltransferase CheR
MSDTTPELTPRQFERFRGFIEARTGIYYPDSRRDALRRGLIARLRESQAQNWEAYRRLLMSSAGETEFSQLLRCVTIGVTAFFRVASHFEALRETLVPATIAERPGGAIRVWSAGCATGEEAYSIAITLAEIGRDLRGSQTQILGTDVSAEAIAHARRGRYSERALSEMTPQRVARYFRRCAGGYEVKPELRRSVTFDEFSLARSSYPRAEGRPWDIIFCRNVTMYFRPETTRHVAARFHQVLWPGGFLVLGATESLSGVHGDFDVIEAQGAFVYVKPPVQSALAALRLPGVATRIQAPVATAEQPYAAPQWATRASDEDEACRIALAAAAAEDWQQAQAALTPFAGVSCRPRLRLLQAWLLASKGACDEAAELCRDLLALDPLLAGAHFILGVLAGRAGDHDQAAHHLSKAIYVDARLAPAYYYLGVAQSERGDYAAARRAFRGGLRALGQGHDGGHDFSDGLTPDQWRQGCEERLAGMAREGL